MPGPMDGVKIVDLSIALAGPWAVTMLAADERDAAWSAHRSLRVDPTDGDTPQDS